MVDHLVELARGHAMACPILQSFNESSLLEEDSSGQLVGLSVTDAACKLSEQGSNGGEVAERVVSLCQ